MSSTIDPNRARLPSLKSLRAFEAASRLGSFAQGAQELSVTPSAISHQIHQLEDFLGVKLFERLAGRTLLTAEGKTYAREIEHAFGIISAATHLVSPQSQDKSFVIATGPSFAVKWLQPRLPGFLNSHPGIGIRISTLSSQDELDLGQFDVAIPYWPAHTSQNKAQPLIEERLRPLCSPTLAEQKGLKTISDLSRVTLIHSANALTWTEYFRAIGHQNIVGQNGLWLDRSMMAIEAAINGLGVILESKFLARKELESGELIAPFEDDQHSIKATTYFLIKSPKAKNTSMIAAFTSWLEKEIKAHGDS
ncbi:transcriptional regulator GcvA [Halotalea alkalilenta]|uniref:transcriptional regulator GcvA n=1 Tax=Halotalea alkalilenta TaxID=376489 RepID=UPI0005B85EB9|nr:transcriptional regulator GcvA [Halotalea alkalilenta]